MSEDLLERCCGLDVHSKTVVACRLTPEAGDKGEVRTFSTTSPGLQELAGWLEESRCTHVAMESTGAYWKPVYNWLEGRFTLVVVNSRYLKMLPGHKTDVLDAEWIAFLLQRGLLRGSAIPSREERELRELSRYRTSLVQERASEINRIQKILEGANIKLSHVASDISGRSGRAMLQALVDGSNDPRLVAALARGRLRGKTDALVEALTGSVGKHQRFVLGTQLRHLGDLDDLIAGVERELEERTRPFAETIERLTTIPGVGYRTACILLAELGTDLRHFANHKQLSAWAGLAPGQHESAGKRRSARTRQGSPWLRSALVQSAHAAARSKSALGERYRRQAGRLGSKKTAVAVAHQILIVVFSVITKGEVYDDERARSHAPDPAQLYVRKLERLGFTVTLEPAA